MWYAVIGGAGLIVGLVLMIWALDERADKQRAENDAKDAGERERECRKIADANRERVFELERQIKTMDDQAAVLRGQLQETRDRLAKCGDPEAVRQWLDHELEGGEV
ncbi:MAG: hypothetical protein MUC88_00460 [Planctomycetes bacterium]|jgi:predicted RNase H-like nuclease (RuvC/YqgF family)|nr:hypothetical protein [Planctomycetota bacterium]